MKLKDFSTEIMLIALIMGSVACLNVSVNNRWKIPNSDLSVAIERMPPTKVGFPYNRELTFDENYQTKSKIKMNDDAGDYSRANIYKISDKIYLIRDFWTTYEINTEAKSLRKIDTQTGGAYVGAFDENASGGWRYIPAEERAEIALGEIRNK